MCFSILQVPRCRIHTLASFWRESFHSLGSTCRSSSSFKLLGSHTNGLEGGNSRRWTRRPITTKSEGRNKYTQSSKRSNIRHEIVDGTVSTSTKLIVDKLEISESQRIQYCEVQEKVTENKDLAKLVTVIVFDTETTGLSRANDRVIEIGLQDLGGGENSTFQTLVNPERIVPNPHVHGITTYMVNRPDVPRWKDLIPILLQYVESRQKPGGLILWVAHNGRSFDVPFLINEFSRCNTEVPPNWRFLDTLPLARELIKSAGSDLPPGASLQALREYYRIPLVGPAHRVLSDVYTLSQILQMLTFNLKLSVANLLDRSFTASDIINPKKKKNSN